MLHDLDDGSPRRIHRPVVRAADRPRRAAASAAHASGSRASGGIRSRRHRVHGGDREAPDDDVAGSDSAGTAAARNILRCIGGGEPLPFPYRDPGVLVILGRNAAVAHVGGRSFTGFPAWALWLIVHIYKLIGSRNRLVVLINWAWDYFFYERAQRLILP